MGKKIRQMRTWLIDHAYLVTIGAVLAVIAASAIYTRGLQAQQETGITAAAQAPETAAAVQPTAEPPTPAPTLLPTITPLQLRYAAWNPSSGTVWPVEGEVLRPYDAQELVLWEMLGAYRVHTALDIAGTAGQEVSCAADGVIAGAVRDELWGWRVTVDQTDGRQAVYAGLQTVDVVQGQAVTRGQQIGVLMEQIPCEGEMPAHLHIELFRDGKPQDPEGMLPER